MIREYGYEYDAMRDDRLWERTVGKVTYDKFQGGIAFRSGRDALKAIAREYDPGIVLLPALSCDSMVKPFEQYGHEVRYYRLKEDYSIEIQSVLSLLEPERNTIFLYMDYFGNPAVSDEELVKLKCTYNDLVFVEDRTQIFIHPKNCGFTPDYIIVSLRKWSSIPDGGLLWNCRPLKNNVFSESVSFSEARLKAQCMRREFLENGDKEIKEEYRKIFETLTNQIDAEYIPGRMSEYAFQMARRTDYKEIAEKRRENAEMLIRNLQNAEIRFVQKRTGISDLYVPILVKNRDVLQEKLAAEGVFCTIIWPLSEKQKSVCAIAKYTAEHILAVYCDQRMTEKDMQYIANKIEGICNE